MRSHVRLRASVPRPVKIPSGVPYPGHRLGPHQPGSGGSPARRLILPRCVMTLRQCLMWPSCPPTAISRTALLSAQGLPGSTIAGFPWSGRIGCATARASPLRDCDTHMAGALQFAPRLRYGHAGMHHRQVGDTPQACPYRDKRRRPWSSAIIQLGAAAARGATAAEEAVLCPYPCSPPPWTGRCRLGRPVVSGFRRWSGPALRRPSRRSS